MSKHALPMVGVAACCLLTGHFCEHESLVVGNDGDPVADAESEVDAGGDARSDGSPAPESGPVTLVVSTMEVLDERLCDLDGDGAEDSAVADLGSPNASLVAAAMTTFFNGFYDNIVSRTLLHFPWVDDLSAPTDPDTELFFLRSEDVDQPPDPSDDLDGDEPFYFVTNSISDCGAPLSTFSPTTIEDGSIRDVEGAVATPLAGHLVTLTGTVTQGTLEPRGTAATGVLCAYPDISELGAVHRPSLGELSALEAFLAGGVAFGVPGLPGISPDLDLDGDGLERFLVDEDDRIVSCVDGDLTVIDGSDCWQDPRIVDSFSLTMRFDAVSARLVGPTPSWWSTDFQRCEDPGGAADVWGPCPADACERWAESGCSPYCGGEGSRRCLWDCSGYTACLPARSERYGLDGCELVELHDATCEVGDTASVPLVGSTGDIAGFRLDQPIRVGRGPVTVEARARASLGTSVRPAYGWSILAYLDEEPAWLADSLWPVGANWERLGWALEWRFSLNLEDPDEEDVLLLRPLVGVAEPDLPQDEQIQFRRIGSQVQPSLDSSTVGWVTQALRLIIEPDLPETEENELVVSGSVLDEAGMPVVSEACSGDLCPPEAQVRVGDSLQVGMGSSTGSDHDALVEIHAADSGGFTVEVAGLCPE